MKKLRSIFGHLAPSGKLSPTPMEEPRSTDPQNALERLLMAAAANPDSRRRFTDALLKADLFVATPTAPAVLESRTLERSETIQILNVTTPDGQTVPAVFTSEIKLAETFGEGTGYVALNGKALFEIVEKSGVWINPTSPYSVVYTPDDLSNLIGKPQRRIIEAETQLLLGSPATIPTKLVERLRTVLSGDNRVIEAFLALAKWPDVEDTTWFLEIGSDADSDSLGDVIGAALQNAQSEGKPVDVIVRRAADMGRLGIRIVPLSSN